MYTSASRNCVSFTAAIAAAFSPSSALFFSGGKEALIKAVAQSIPVFAMTVFNIPKKIYKGITDAILQF
jgi:hypothetical protein